MELATNRDAISARITASTVAPPPKDMPIGMEKAVAMAGAMNVIDWNRTPPKPTAPGRSTSAFRASVGGGGGGDGGIPAVPIGALLSEGTRNHGRPSVPFGLLSVEKGNRPGRGADQPKERPC